MPSLNIRHITTYHYRRPVSFGEHPQAYGAALSSTLILIAAALFVVYLILGVLYESVIHPITIISTLPSAVGGLLLSQLLTLYTTPVVYIYLDKLQSWMFRNRMKQTASTQAKPLPAE